MTKSGFNYCIGFLIAVTTIIFCGACATLSNGQLAKIEEKDTLRTLALNKEYIFDNLPYYIMNTDVNDTPSYYHMLWVNFDPRFQTQKMDWTDYRVKIEVVSARRVNSNCWILREKLSERKLRDIRK